MSSAQPESNVDVTGARPAVGVVGVVVVTFASPEGVVEACLRALLAHRSVGGRDADVVVVDTGGRARRRLGETAPGLLDDVELVESDNVGFGAAVNLGARRLLDRGADVVACLNDDVIVDPGWLDPLVAELVSDASIGAVQPLLGRLGSDPPVIDGAGVELDRFGAGSDIARGQSVDAVVEPTQVDAVTGGAAVFTRKFLDDVGGFDERFFLYYEDVELCRRGAASGWSFRVVPASRVWHVGSASTGRLGANRLLLQERNRLWCTAMHGSAREVVDAFWLSIRRLRHEPRSVHRRALVAGARGAAQRLYSRLRRRPSRWDLDETQRHTPAERWAFRPVDGVNVVGYLHLSSGLGDAAREFSASLQAAGVPVVEVDNDLGIGQMHRRPNPLPGTLHQTSVVFNPAFDLATVRDRFPELFASDRRVIGYWFWELEAVPDSHIDAMRLVDEVWTASAFVEHAYDAVAERSTRIRRVPLRLPEPTVSDADVARWRDEFGGSFVFLVSFDYLSFPERKNPGAAVRAFLEAFESTADVGLVVKSLNRDQRPDAAEALEAQCADDPRISFVDANLTDAEHHGLIAAADCLVSPHRSEGLGLQPAAAMWLGTPVIVTAYGGVLDFCDDDTALLCGYDLVPVVGGRGVYPDGAPWADIRHEELVEAMRTVRGDDRRRAALVESARRRIERQPTRAEFGRTYRDLLAEL